MSKDAKDPKHRPDGLRQPQRKDSLSSVLSWAALQGKITTSKAPTASPSTLQSSQPSPGTTSKPRRHSHSAGSETKTKARRGSTTFRRLSFSAPTTTQSGASTKTRHAKTSMAPDPKASPGTSKSGKNGSSEKVNKAASENSDGTTPNRPQTAKSRSMSMSSPICMPKSILRVSSPDGDRRPRQFFNPQTGEPASPGLPPISPGFGTISPDSPPGSPPTSPIPRPMSPGATVRFAKATIHRVEVGPGRRFLPVKRKSKSTLTYISPLDPGTQKSAPKTMLQSPTKMRRHQENQAAMGRYWLRTEEEEAQWRAEAERRAQEEAEKYRNEPASSPPPAAPVVANAAEEAGGAAQSSLADAMAAIDKLPPLDSGPALEKVEEEAVESEDEDEEAGAKCNPMEAAEVVAEQSSAGKLEADTLGKANGEYVATEDSKKPGLQTEPEPTQSPAPAHTEASEPKPATTAAAPLELAAKPATSATPAPPASTQTSPEAVTLAESKSFFERLAEKQAADERANRAPSLPAARSISPQLTTQPPIETLKPPRSSSSSLSKQKPAPATPTGRSSSASTSSSSSSSSAEQLTKAPSREKEKEKEKERDRTKEKTRSSTNLRSASGGGSGSGLSKGMTDRTSAAAAATTSSTRGSSSSSGSHSHSHSHSSSNHLHLSGRRGRRYFEDRERERQGQRYGIMA